MSDQNQFCSDTMCWHFSQLISGHVIMLKLPMVSHNNVKLPLFIKHALSISIVGLSLGITSLYKT